MSEERWAGDALDPEDMAIPEIKLVQNVGGATAKELYDARPGQFFCELTGEVLNEFNLVIIKIQKNRTYWGRSEIEEDPPECASLDAKSMVSVDGKDCSTCQYRNEAPWLVTAEERRKLCLVNYNILGINLDNDLPVLVRTGGISAMATKQLYTQLSLNRQIAHQWYKAKTKVSSVPKKTAVGDAFSIKFGVLELIPQDRLEELAMRSQELLGTEILLPGAEEIPMIEEAPRAEDEPVAPTVTPVAPVAPVAPVEESKLDPIDVNF